MVVVQLCGGLGNQMFGYALYLKLREMGREAKIDDFTCYGPGERPRQLSIFGLDYERATKKEYEALTDSCMRIDHRIRRKLFGRKSLYYREKSANFDPAVLQKDPAVLQGYFQTEKYFANIEAQVREAFVFRNLKKDEALLAYEEKIEGCLAVSVHIRRGDYLEPNNRELFGDICTPAYYEKAMALIREQFPEAVFFFFTNDPAWVKQHYAKEGNMIVEGAGEDNGYRDLYLMSRCRHHILANSSFSWWGAWLNDRPDKVAIVPDRWLNGQDCRDIYCDWMKRDEEFLRRHKGCCMKK